jgi:soluble lytic murein transglycosylase-like protein
VLILAAINPKPVEAAVGHNCKRYVDMARAVGWPKSERANLARIMWRESRCTPTAHNPLDPWGGSHGLLQINGSNVGWATRQGYINTRNDLTDPKRNLKVGLELWKLYGWKPWGTKSSVTTQTTERTVQK